MTAAQRQFEFGDISEAGIVEELECFSLSGQLTVREERYGVPYLFNEFWTARQRQGHSLHEVSYRACFKPQLPEFFISRLTSEGDCVYDPFMGRGTTVLQAGLMNRNAIGNDINPLSRLLCRPRLSIVSLADISQRLGKISWEHEVADDDDLLVFYHRETLKELRALRAYFLQRDALQQLDPIDDWIRMVAINRLTGHSSGFFSVYSLPPNQAVSLESQRRINVKRAQVPPRRSVPDIIAKKSRSLLKDGDPPRADARFHVGPADDTPVIPSGSVDLVVTSPPFLDIVQYAGDNWLRCWFAGIDHESVNIAMHRKPEDWTRWIGRVLMELARVVRSGGHVAFEVGEVRNGSVELDKLVLEASQALPFDRLCVAVNVQEFTKTANCWGVSNNSKGTNSNRIVLLRRH